VIKVKLTERAEWSQFAVDYSFGIWSR